MSNEEPTEYKIPVYLPGANGESKEILGLGTIKENVLTVKLVDNHWFEDFLSSDMVYMGVSVYYKAGIPKEAFLPAAKEEETDENSV